ncbi:hypothetical protein BGZ97_002178, partial [Linnemannia gamsii]
PTTGLPTPIDHHLARRQLLSGHTLSLPAVHRRRLTTDPEAEAGVVIPPTISIREVEEEAEAEMMNVKRGLPRSPGGSRPGSGTYYPGQPYGRRSEEGEDLS